MSLCKDIKVCGGRSLHDRLARGTQWGLGQSAMLTATKQQISKGITAVGVFVLVGCISESLMPSSHGNSLKMVTAGK